MTAASGAIPAGTDAERILAEAQADCGCRIPSPFNEVAEHAIILAEAEGFKRGQAYAPASGGAGEREALLIARSWVKHAGNCASRTTVPTDDGFKYGDCTCDCDGALRIIDAALHPHPTGEGELPQNMRELSERRQWHGLLVQMLARCEAAGLSVFDELHSATTAAIADLASPPPAADAVPEEAYLVWSNEHRAWWKPESCGYTRVVERAGRYSRNEAFAISRTRGGGWPADENPYEIAIPERDAVAQSSARPLAATGKGVGTPSRSDGGGNG